MKRFSSCASDRRSNSVSFDGQVRGHRCEQTKADGVLWRATFATRQSSCAHVLNLETSRLAVSRLRSKTFTGRLMTQLDGLHERSHYCSTSALPLSYQLQDASVVLQRLRLANLIVRRAASTKHRLSQCMSLIILFKILPPVVKP